MNDLWTFDTTTNTWTFVAGTNLTDAPAVSGNPGAFSPAFHPAGVQDMCGWLDFSGRSFNIFGGVTAGKSLFSNYQYLTTFARRV